MSQFTKVETRDEDRVVYVVHGIGKQRQGETAAKLWGGFDDAFIAIRKWRVRNNKPGKKPLVEYPAVREGYWADYDNAKRFFRGDWKTLTEEEQAFYKELYQQRTISAGYTYTWFMKQVLRLLDPAKVFKVMAGSSLLTLPLYFLMVPTSMMVLTVVRFKKADILKDFLNDIRLYIDPRGKIEHDIVDAINKMVAKELLLLIGLSPDFKPLPREEWLSVRGHRKRYERVILVAHSLGTVICYNVIVDLVKEALRLLKEGTDEQKAGVKRFKGAITRFVTLGSPLDKVAALFGEASVRKWPDVSRREFFDHAETVNSFIGSAVEDWWINFYHVLDPISGSLEAKLICRNDPPSSFHSRKWISPPGIAHGAYWKDLAILRYILSRAFGRDDLEDRPLRRLPVRVLTMMAGAAHFIWFVSMLAVMATIVAWVWGTVDETWQKILDFLEPYLRS